MSLVQEAARVKAPAEGKVFSRATTTSVVRYEIPPAWKGAFVTISVKTAAIQIQFGDSAVVIVADQSSSLSTETLTVHDSTGGRVAKDATQSFIVPSTATHMSIVGEAAGQWFGQAG